MAKVKINKIVGRISKEVAEKYSLYEFEGQEIIQSLDLYAHVVKHIDEFQSLDSYNNTLLNIEAEFKRERVIRWGPRTLDLDIIFYDDIISYDEHILIPHPRAHERQFVMKPMCDINPYFVHPVYRRRVMDISNELEEL